MARNTCSTCDAFNPIGNECRRESPRAFAVNANGNIQVVGGWPGTSGEKWCLMFVAEGKGETKQ